MNEQNIKVIQELNEHAKQRGQTLAQMALSWVLRENRITSALIVLVPVRKFLKM